MGVPYPSMLIMESSDPGTPLTRIIHESPAWGLLDSNSRIPFHSTGPKLVSNPTEKIPQIRRSSKSL